MSFRIVSLFLLLAWCQAVPAASEGLVFSPDQMNIRYYRGGEAVDDPTAPSGKAARVGRDWSIQWFMARKAKPMLDYTHPYDVIVRCKGEFKLGMYGTQRSGNIVKSRQIGLPEGEWRDIRIGREKLHPQDYLTTDGVGKLGLIGQVRLVPHPFSEAERAMTESGEPMVSIDADQKAECTLTGTVSAPIRLKTLMEENSFCPNPSARIETVSRSGRRQSLPVAVGLHEIVLSASADDPVESVSIVVPGGAGRSIVYVSLPREAGASCALLQEKSSFQDKNSYDLVQTNEAMKDFLRLQRYDQARAELFGKSDAPFVVLPESSMRKVFQDLIPNDFLRRKIARPLSVSLARAEAEHLQFVVIPRDGNKAACRVEYVASGDGDGISVGFEKLGYVQSRRRAYTQLTSETAMYPDPLLPLTGGRIDLAGVNQPVWMTVKAAGNAKAGRHDGEVRFYDGADRLVAAFPLNIRVRSFALPERSKFRTCFFLNRHSMIDYFDCRNDWETEKALSRKIIAISAENRLTLMPMLEHRPQWLQPLWTATVDKQGNYHFDFTRENELTRMILDEFHGNGYNVSPSPTWDRYFGYMWVTDPATGKVRRLSYSMNDPEFEKIYRQFLTAAWENARRNNWTKYAYHYIWDESSGDAWNRLHLLSKKFVPELKNLAVGYDLKKMDETVRDAVDIYVPLSSRFDRKFTEERVAKGDEMWAYVCVVPKDRYNLFIDHEAFSHRALLWWFRDRDLSGLLYWGVCVWDRASQAKNEGRVWPDAVWEANQFPDGNGDGFLLYPDLKKREIYGSLRLAVLRDGLEDMEYFLLLNGQIAQAKNSSSDLDRAWLKRASAMGERISSVIAGEVGNGPAFDYNGESLEKVRREIGDLIEEYQGMHPQVGVK